jgi:hypothetical protein
MLNFYEDCGFDSEDELIEYLESLRDSALLSDDDDSQSSLARDLSASFAEVTAPIAGLAGAYVEYVSPEPLNQVKEGVGYSVEATIISPEIVFWDPSYMQEDEEWDDYFEYIQGHDYFANGADIVLNSDLNPDSDPILKALTYSDEDFYLGDDISLLTISVGLPKHGLNLFETDTSENKWVFRLFGKISGLVTANSPSEAKSRFAQVIQESFSFIESDLGTNKFSHHEFLDGKEMEIISEDSNWLIPIQHVFVNIRKQIN